MITSRFSKLGFILAAVGSAVGLGNIWKFPYVTGEYGGGAFVLVYLITALFIGVFVLISELVIGKLGRSDAVTMFETLATKHKKLWKYAGFIIIVPLIILAYYSVVIGWIFHYIAISIQGLPQTVEQSKDIFIGLLTTDIQTQLLYHTVVFVLVTAIILQGIKDGIEKINKILMPLLGIILAILLVYSINVDSFSKAFQFMFNPDFTKLSSEAVVVAIGQAFYTLSLGMGIIITYAASLPKDSNVVKSSILISIIDTMVAIVAGLIIFTLLFDKGAESTKGAGLVFISLPSVFYEFGSIGSFLALLFFIAIAFAGITSAISMLEPTVEYFENRFNFSRIKAAMICSIFFYVLGIAALLSNIESYSSVLMIGEKGLFDWLDFVCSTILVPIGGILVVVFIGHYMDKEAVENELIPLMGTALTKFWFFMVRFVIPFALIIVILNETGIFKF
ncbi:sodium-dependent transporter [Halarcobacter bivalviorum]|uniref:Transporter n=1 Tax=Halarcobacter bivalviorum TaxID=663364 RepID=A0AAX2A8V8_9BACT|nr:sodium-dependent transporter [Halarcobacter bivalviorum]AXH12720.1 sodium-dependent transporter, SNF family [Halarcobacter bivalviorum]RXK08155.1 sodium-dependent transporter [Halarcobacter bivalviorum]RXK10359.1 sodium-dependent transporter [Halarcobacter bivalviorum]